MESNSKSTTRMEWVCRILLTIHLIMVVSGYIAYWQTSYQLISPLIPRNTIHQVSEPYWQTGLVMSGLFLAALWCYFFKKRAAAILITGIAFILYQPLLYYFAVGFRGDI